MTADALLARIAADRARTVGPLVLCAQLGGVALAGVVPIGLAAVAYNAIAISLVAVAVRLTMTRRLPVRWSHAALALVWWAALGGTLMSQLYNHDTSLAIVVLIELASVAVFLHTRLAAWSVAGALALYLPLVLRDAGPLRSLVCSSLVTAAVCGMILQILVRRSLVRAEVHRLGELATAEELERRIAELRRSEDERGRLRDRLRHSQRIEAVGTLAAGLAHDLNNVLAGIANHASVHLVDAPPELAHHIQQVIDQTARGGELTRSLLAFGRRGQYRKQPVRFADIIGDARLALERTLPAGCNVDVRLATGDAIVDADRIQLGQVLVNLCRNAADAMQGAGTIVVTGDRVVLDDTGAQSFGVEPGRYVCCSVTDFGSGMDAATCDRVFEPFFTTKARGRGTGLGLAVVWGVVQAHGGAIRFASELGHGSTFLIALPEAARPVAAATVSSGRAIGAGTVLVIDDEPTVRTGTQRLLARKGYRVLTAGDGAEGLEVFAAHAVEIGLVILDMGMPVMGGAECFARLRERSDVPILIATGYAIDAELQGLVSQGAAVIEKPYPASELLREVARMLAATPATALKASRASRPSQRS